MEKTNNMIQVNVCGQTKEFPSGMTYAEIAGSWEGVDGHKILLVKENDYKLHEMDRRAKKDCSLSFLTIADKEGRDTYKRSLCLMMLKAFDNVLGRDGVHVWIRFTVSGGLYCTLDCDHATLSQELLDHFVRGRWYDPGL